MYVRALLGYNKHNRKRENKEIKIIIKKKKDIQFIMPKHIIKMIMYPLIGCQT